MSARSLLLRERLEALRERYDERYLQTDPIQFPRRYARVRDREVVGLVASSLAYGNVKAIANSLNRVIAWMGPRPARFAETISPKEALRSLGTFQHRWTRARDVACLVHFAGQMIARNGSIGAFFEKSYVTGDMAQSLAGFSSRALALDHGGLYRTKRLPPDAGVRFFFTSPRTGACKRMNMYLRWMARPDDGVDFGLWSFVHTRDLVMPLDTHIYRIGRHLGWTRRRTQGFPTALDITGRLARVDPDDPVKYDFALSRMGILENCPRHSRRLVCELCDLKRELRARRTTGAFH